MSRSQPLNDRLALNLDNVAIPEPPVVVGAAILPVAPASPGPINPASPELLDDEQVWQGFSQCTDRQSQAWESSVLVEGMHCAACASRVENALRRVPGVLAAEVSAGSHRARILWQANRTRPSAWIHAVESAGYSVLPAYDSRARERRLQESRQALWRVMVAGVCMMQIMMYAYPAYTASPGDLSPELMQLLRWASWVLSLPVLIFCCGPFFSAAWADIRARRVSMDLPVALGMLITFVVSSAGTFHPNGIFGREVYFDSLTMFVFFLLAGRWLEVRMRGKTSGALEALMNQMPESAERQKEDGEFERVAINRLAPGDIIRVLPGDAIAADGILISGSTEVDESLLSGESRPLPREPGDALIAGSHNILASVLMRATKVGQDTRFAQVLNLMQSASVSRPELAKIADAIAKPFLVGILLLAAGACAYWWSTDPQHALMVAVAVLVVTCPCALSLATPVAMLASAGALARRGVLVRDLSALEALAKVDTVVFDKTGTLTEGVHRLKTIHVRPGESANNALAVATSMAMHSRHPLSIALVRAAKLKNVESQTWFSTDVRELSGRGISARVQRPDDASGFFEARLGSAAFCGLTQGSAQAAQVVLADARGWMASFDFEESMHPQAVETTEALRREGLSVHMLSGDRHDAADVVARALRIEEVNAESTPEQKLDRVKHVQSEGRRAAFVGDGLNDGPVMAAASVSFAMGHAVPMTKSRADFWISSARLSDVVLTYRLAKRTMRVVAQNLGWALAYNIVCVPLAVAGMLPAWLAGLGMAASSLLVVLNARRLNGQAQALQADRS